MTSQRAWRGPGVCLFLGVLVAATGERARAQLAYPDDPGPILLMQGQSPPPSPTPPSFIGPPRPVPVPTATRPPVPPPSPPDQEPRPSRTSVSSLPESREPEMLGDAPPLNLLLPTPAGPVLVPRSRGFKIDDNENPDPQDRTYFTFNYFNDLNAAVNQRLGGAIHNINFQRETFGLEKAFCCDTMSFGLRVPVNTVSAQSSVAALNGTRTSWGDVSFIYKAVLLDADEDGVLVSGGLAVTPPTGAGSLFGDPQFERFRDTTLQPYLGYRWAEDRWYLQGFSSIDVATDRNDVTLLFNDLSVKYFYLWDPEPTRFLTAVIPTAELHVNTPLNHRGVLRTDDPAGTSDLVDVTVGVDVRFFDRVKLVLGFVTPLTGPRPLALEVLNQFKMTF
jgi:hypothetical protein